MIKLGLTGSIGMGKSTTAAMFARFGVPVHDADSTVHRLYGGSAAPLIEAAFPGTTENGTVDRAKLAAMVVGNPDAMARLERIVHPLVRDAERAFLAEYLQKGTKLVVLDIPLLFETGGEERVDRIVVVSAPKDVQRARVLERPGMTAEKFEAIVARQMPDEEKRRRADFVVDTAKGIDHAREAVAAIIENLTGERPTLADGD